MFQIYLLKIKSKIILKYNTKVEIYFFTIFFYIILLYFSTFFKSDSKKYKMGDLFLFTFIFNRKRFDGGKYYEKGKHERKIKTFYA